MGALEANTTLIYGIHLRESANDGSDFGNGATDYRIMFLGEDGQLHVKDSAGVVTDIGGAGDVAADSIWDAAGDLAVGSGANTAAKLAIGSVNGMALRRVAGAVAWDYPPGYQFDYATRTSDLTITGTTEGSPTTIITGNAVTYDGSTEVVIEFFCTADPAATAAASLTFYLMDGGTSIGLLGSLSNPAPSGTNVYRWAGTLKRILTPSAASHTYGIAASQSVGNGSIRAGVGGNGARVPAFMRITKS